jgi:hypothetical protein
MRSSVAGQTINNTATVSTDALDVKSATDSDIAVICVDCAAVRYHLPANMNACMACNTTQ